MNTIDIGTRKLQHGAGGHVLNVPVIAVRALGLHTGDVMRWSIVDGGMRIEKESNAPQGIDVNGGHADE